MDIWYGNATVCPRSSDPFYVVSYYIKWVTTSWAHSIREPYYHFLVFLLVVWSR